LYSSSDPNPLKASDTAWSTDIRAALFLPLPTERSHLELTASASQMHYNFFDNLNYTKKQFEGMYVWEYDTWIRGRLRHRIDDRLYSYFGGNSPAPQLEVPHIREDQAELALRVSSRFDLPVTLTQQTLRYMVPSNAQPFNMDSNAAQVAIRYESGTKSTLSAGIKRTRVNFPFRSATDIVALDSGYTDQELFLDTAWRYSEDTVVIGHLGTVSRRFATYADRNSNLISAEIGADWHYSPKTTFIARIWDQPQANIEASNRLYVVSTGILGRMIWQSTPKTRFSLLASLEIRNTKVSSVALPSTTAAAKTGFHVSACVSTMTLRRGWHCGLKVHAKRLCRPAPALIIRKAWCRSASAIRSKTCRANLRLKINKAGTGPGNKSRICDETVCQRRTVI